jgi:hypothetical protein
MNGEENRRHDPASFTATGDLRWGQSAANALRAASAKKEVNSGKVNSRSLFAMHSALRVKKEVKAYTDTRGRSALSALCAAPPILPRNGRPKKEANHRRAHSARASPSFGVTGVRRRKPITGERIPPSGRTSCGVGCGSTPKPVSGERIPPSGRTSCGVRYGSTPKPVSVERIPSRAPALSSENRRRTKTEKDQESFSCPGGGCESFVGQGGNAGTTFLRLWRFLYDAKVLSAGRHSWGERLCLSGPGGMRHQSYPRG